MSDEALRRLERRWKRTGSVGDEARVLAERLRVGAIDRKHLDIAVLLGHEAALLACGVAAPDLPDFDQDVCFEDGGWRLIEPWLERLARITRDTPARIAWLFARGLVPTWTAAHPGPNPPLEAFQLCEAWLRGPRRRLAARRHAQSVASKAWDFVMDVDPADGWGPYDAALDAGNIFGYVALSVTGTITDEHLRSCGVGDAADAAAKVALGAYDAAHAAAGWRSEPGEQAASSRWVYDRLLAELVPWVLGHHDPLS